MSHGVGHRKLGKKSSHRLAMFANMATSLIKHERIETTLPKAKELRKFVEKLITKGKKGDIHSRRKAHSFLRDDAGVQKLFDNIAKRFADRKGGYTRILKKARVRVGDAAEMAVVELVDYVLPVEEKSKKKKAS